MRDHALFDRAIMSELRSRDVLTSRSATYAGTTKCGIERLRQLLLLGQVGGEVKQIPDVVTR